MTMRVPSYYEVHRMFYFNLYSMNNDEEMRYLWTILADLSKEAIHILVEFKPIEQQNIPSTQNKNTTTLPEHITAITHEGEFHPPLNPENPVNPVTKNIVQQWESSQWFSNARYDYIHSGAFLDMGSGSSIDDIIESGTVRLPDWTTP
ncbi:hypothetical protein M9H77_33667 [Catharanthus roseus]|uniref:Uncharacterized protein n=1 Tax=Catharanthus roseus TaxID=4058 RepID=A0ACB9ZJ49_CATRO|nr:hypothetical protein M9H77_33667 [Catharanthus roseus]